MIDNYVATCNHTSTYKKSEVSNWMPKFSDSCIFKFSDIIRKEQALNSTCSYITWIIMGANLKISFYDLATWRINSSNFRIYM